MLILKVTAVVSFQGTRLAYSEGALHSDGDAPALEFVAGTGKKNRLPLVSAISLQEDVMFWMPISPDVESRFARFDAATENWWYARGELHRDFGPAIAGFNAADRDNRAVYWLKFDRGVLGGNLLNAYGNELAAGGSLFACAPGAVVCAFISGTHATMPAISVYTNAATIVLAASPLAHGLVLAADISYGSNLVNYMCECATPNCACGDK
jgi:hypothetical protein